MSPNVTPAASTILDFGGYDRQADGSRIDGKTPLVRTIAIDTSHAGGSVAASDGPGFRTRSLGPAGGHARTLAAAVAEVTAELGWAVGDADLVAVVRGPGSFTGLRVGIATAQAIAWAGRGRLVGVSGFEVVASLADATRDDQRKPLHMAYDAGRGEVFVATAAVCDRGRHVSAGRLEPIDRWVASLPHGAWVSGPAVVTLADRLLAAGHLLPPPAAWCPTAAAVAQLGMSRAWDGAADTAATLVPDYIRPSYADERPGSPS